MKTKAPKLNAAQRKQVAGILNEVTTLLSYNTHTKFERDISYPASSLYGDLADCLVMLGIENVRPSHKLNENGY